MRDSKGRFTKGYDKDRHLFTREECLSGYNSALDRFIAKWIGTDTARRYLFRRMLYTEQKRYPNCPLIVEVTKFGVNRKD